MGGKIITLRIGVREHVSPYQDSHIHESNSVKTHGTVNCKPCVSFCAQKRNMSGKRQTLALGYRGVWKGMESVTKYLHNGYIK